MYSFDHTLRGINRKLEKVISKKVKARERTVLKTAIIVDYMGHGFGEVTPQMEIEEHKKDFHELLFPAKLDVYTPFCMSEDDIQIGTDLIIFDWGSMMPGNSLMEDNSRRLIQYAQDHSDCLCIVVSTFTWRNAIQYEMEELGLGKLHNVVCRYWESKELWSSEREPEDWDPIPAWFRELHKLPVVDPYEAGQAIKAGKLTIPEGKGK